MSVNACVNLVLQRTTVSINMIFFANVFVHCVLNKIQNSFKCVCVCAHVVSSFTEVINKQRTKNNFILH